MFDFHQQIRKTFNINHHHQSLQITLINPYLTNQSISQLSKYLLNFNLTNPSNQITKLDINIIQCVTFDDQMLVVLGTALPLTIKELTLDFTGCESIKGSGLLDLFENVSQMSLEKLHLDFSQVYDINDIVLEGLGMLIESLPELRELYLDFYEIDQITESGYMVLAESLNQLPHLQSLHLDFSANPSLTEDNLQLFFGNLPHTLTSLSFRILDIDGIGGGSFFRLASFFSKCSLEKLNLTISTFSELNPKSMYSLLKEISQIKTLVHLSINFSNTNMPNKLLGYLKIPSSVKNLVLDVSCNSSITDTDLLSLFTSLSTNSQISQITLNFDFCKNITQDSVILGLTDIIQMTATQQLPSTEQPIALATSYRPLTIKLTDRKYSSDFIEQILQQIDKINNQQSQGNHKLFLNVDFQSIEQHRKWRLFQNKQQQRLHIMYQILIMRKNKSSNTLKKAAIKMLTP